MAGGGIVSTGPVREYPGHATWFVVITCIKAASSGLIFGYDIGISGGVTSMDDFLQKFFPHVYEQKHNATSDSHYCTFNSQVLTTFTSSLYIAGLITSFFASIITRKFGRKRSILLGGASFLVGAALNGAAENVSMLIIGRILLGVGVGFVYQSVPIYLSEMAPAKWRGALFIMVQLAITIGILCANILNYYTQKITPWGWRLSLGLAGVPAIIMTTGSLFLPDTPNSLIERGYLDRGQAMLVKVRGTTDVQAEFDDILEASKVAKSVKHPWRNILQTKHRPQFMMSLLIPFFQQLTGINAIMFYAPVLFQTVGFGNDASLYSAVIMGAVNVLSTIVSIIAVDRYGRRSLFLEGGFQMFFAQVIVGSILGAKFGLQGTGNVDKATAVGVVIVICVYVASFAWSWGPLAGLVPSEIFPLEIRSAGVSINLSVNLFFTWVIAQTFLPMLCHFKFGIFLFFAGWVLIMTMFVYYLVPETKNVPIERMAEVWRRHPYWGSFVPAEDRKPLKQDVELVADQEKRKDNGAPKSAPAVLPPKEDSQMPSSLLV